MFFIDRNFLGQAFVASSFLESFYAVFLLRMQIVLLKGLACRVLDLFMLISALERLVCFSNNLVILAGSFVYIGLR